MAASGPVMRRVFGTDGDDIPIGTRFRDLIFGREGNDLNRGLGGNGRLDGGDRNHGLDAGRDRALMTGGGGADTLPLAGGRATLSDFDDDVDDDFDDLHDDGDDATSLAWLSSLSGPAAMRAGADRAGNARVLRCDGGVSILRDTALGDLDRDDVIS